MRPSTLSHSEFLARFGPEGAGQIGVAGLDREITSLTPAASQAATIDSCARRNSQRELTMPAALLLSE